MKCLQTGQELNSEEWRKSPNCKCPNCEEYFRRLRVSFRSDIPLVQRMMQVAAELERERNA